METAESSAVQPTSSVVRTLEAEDDASAKRKRLMAGMPILHETDLEVSVDAHRMVVIRNSGPSGRLTRTRDSSEPRVEPCLTHRRCMRVG